MNTGVVTVVTPGSVIPVIDSQETPKIADWGTLWCQQDNYNAYLAPGNHEIRFYSFWDDAWLTNYKKVFTNNSAANITYSKADGLFTITDWQGGLVNMPTGRYVFTDETYDLPDAVALLVNPDNSIMPTTENIKWTYGLFTQRIKADGETYDDCFNINSDQFAFKVYEVVDAKVTGYGAEMSTLVIFNIIFDNYGEPRDWKMVRDSSYCWYIPNAFGDDLKLKFTGTRGDLQLMNATITRVIPPCIYLVGSVTGWVEPDQANQEHYDNYRLRRTTDNAYYGGFDIPADQTIFRFYSRLNGWEKFSYGYQYNDVPTDFSFINNDSYPLQLGKGSYNFTDWPGGMMYMKVSLDEGYMLLSNEPMNVEYADGLDTVEAYTAKPTDNRIFNLQGVCMGTSTDGLPAGLYIRGGKKIILGH